MDTCYLQQFKIQLGISTNTLSAYDADSDCNGRKKVVFKAVVAIIHTFPPTCTQILRNISSLESYFLKTTKMKIAQTTVSFYERAKQIECDK